MIYLKRFFFNTLSSFLLLSVSSLLFAQKPDLKTKFEKTKGEETVTYQEGIEYLEKLDKQYAALQLFTYGKTDIGKPIHLAVVSANRVFDPEAIRNSGKTILFINNNIHPGEPDGIDASLLLLRDLLSEKKYQPLLENTVICLVPFYNVDGTLNRGSYSRANQNGPNAFGFRGNSRNFDLNRDFIKNDTYNAKTFAQLFHTWQPDVMIDNHVSNGADYQYVMTYIPTQKDKLGEILGKYLDTKLVPELEQRMKESKFEMTPYVNQLSTTPDSAGIMGFPDSPRYSTGYVALFQTIGFMPETHMLKPYTQRVASDYEFMLNMLKILQKDGKLIRQLRQQALENIKNQTDFPVEWKLNKEDYRRFIFKGYEASMIPSKVTTGKRLYYDRKKPFEKEIPYYNTFVPKTIIRKPKAYIIPSEWEAVTERLRNNRVQLQTLKRDTTIEVEAYYIADYKTSPRAYEGHYLHSEVKLTVQIQKITFKAGDILVYPNQTTNRYIIETLEPQATDSFFNWNFFDSILQQKEGYSDYVFEDIAEKLLKEDNQLKQMFEAKKQSDEKFRQNSREQLDFIYKNSPYYEKTHLRYPVFRLKN